MRVLPHAVARAGRPAAEVARDAVLDGAATHGHPRALLGAAAYAQAARFLLNRDRPLRPGELVEALLDERRAWGHSPNAADWPGRADAAHSAVSGYESLRGRVSNEMESLLSTARDGAPTDDRAVLDRLGCFGRERGAGTVTVAAAAYLASRHAAGPVEAVVRAAFSRPGDTDTLAAMTGGLLGCLRGADRLPAEWRAVQDAACLSALAARVAAGPERAPDAPVGRIPPRSELLADLERSGGEELPIGSVFRARAAAWGGARAAARSLRIRSWRLATAEGQTLYLHFRERVEPPRAPRRPPRSAEASSSRGRSHRLPLTRARRTLAWFDDALTYRRPGVGVGGFRAWAEVDGKQGFVDDGSFLGGSAGIGLALLAALTDTDPAWDRLLLLS